MHLFKIMEREIGKQKRNTGRDNMCVYEETMGWGPKRTCIFISRPNHYEEQVGTSLKTEQSSIVWCMEIKPGHETDLTTELAEGKKECLDL